MPWLYGSLPVALTALKSFTLAHPDFNGGSPATVTITTSADFVGFVAAVALVNTAVSTASGGDLTFAWGDTTSRATFTSAAGKAWSIEGFTARGFFGFKDYPSNYEPAGGTPFGALWLEGLSVDDVEIVSSAQSRDEGEGYNLLKGYLLSCSAFMKVNSARQSRHSAPGLGTSLDWAAFKGVVTCQPNSIDSSPWSLSNMDGKITDAKLIGYTLEAQESFMGSKIWPLKLRLQID